MKKILSILLVLALCVGFSACGAAGKVELPPVPTAENTAPAVQPENEPAAPAAEPVPAPTVQPPERTENLIVTIEKTEKEAYDPQNGETLILRFSYDTPRVYSESAPEAAEAINEYLALLNEAFYTGDDFGEGYGIGYNDILMMAEDNYNYMVESQMEYPTYEYTDDRSVTVVRNDRGILCFCLNDSIYTGGAHGAYTFRYYNFDPKTGALLKLSDLSADEEGFKALLTAQMIELAQTDEKIQQQIAYAVNPANYESAFGALLRDGSWYLGYDGLTFTSDPYEISDYASGPVSFVIPYDRLSDYMDPALVPAEAGAGSFRALSEDALPDGSVEIVDLVKTDEDGSIYYLVAEGSVQDVQITQVKYSGLYFFDLGLLWGCSEMDNAAVQLVTLIPEGMPNLKLSYRDEAGQHVYYLSASGVDGEPMLVDDSIEAVG